MSTPMGHSLAGLSLFFVFGRRYAGKLAIWKRAVIYIVFANLPDIDIIAGVFRGNINYYHHRFTHSFLFAVMVSALAWLMFRFKAVPPRLWAETRKRVIAVVFILILSHLFLDYITIDKSPPLGMPLFSPFSSRYFYWTHAFMPSASRGNSLLSIFNPDMLKTAICELAVFSPFALLTYYLCWMRGKRL